MSDLSTVDPKDTPIGKMSGHHHHDGDGHHVIHQHFKAPLAAATGRARRTDSVRPSLFLASALDRLLVAIVLSGLLWIGVVWAVS